MKTILVTGGAGFIGSHLTARFAREGHRVFCLDSLLTGDLSNLEGLQNAANVEVIEHDICDPLPASLKPDEIYNMACAASPVFYQRDPIHTMRTNVVGMLNVLERAAESGARVLQASTSEIYGEPAEHPQPESYTGNVNTTGPRACYNEGKRAAEALCFDFHRQRRVPIKIARIFNTYGPKMLPQDGRVVSNFVMRALAGDALEIYGDGRQTRSFCYITDMVEGLVRLQESDPGLLGPVNLGNDSERTVGEVAQVVLAATGSHAPLRYLPAREDDPIRRRPDITLARNALGWSPEVPLEAGVADTVAYFRKTHLPSPQGA